MYSSFQAVVGPNGARLCENPDAELGQEISGTR